MNQRPGLEKEKWKFHQKVKPRNILNNGRPKRAWKESKELINPRKRFSRKVKKMEIIKI